MSLIQRKRLLLPMHDPMFWQMYSAACAESERAGWYFSEERSRPVGTHLVLYFWRDGAAA